MNTVSWRHYPWLLGLLLAPLLLGSVIPEGQAVVGLLFSTSLLLLCLQMGGHSVPNIAPFWRWSAAILLILPLVPLPIGVVGLLSPQRAALAQTFAPGPGEAAAWLTLSLSPDGTVQRLWELALIITCFWLARSAATQVGFPRTLAAFVGAALLLLAASDVWFRLNDRRSILGLWELSWGNGAGTFANRNHFAGWSYMAVLFVAGWIIRVWHPLQSARQQSLQRTSRHRIAALAWSAIALFGLVMAVASGSRGALLALFAGVVVWVILLGQRSRSRRRWLVIGLLAVTTFIISLEAGELLLQRFAQLKLELVHRYSKVDIWRDALSGFSNFPLFGTGWGSFVTTFTLFKTFAGESTFWHAENDYVQLLVECGLVGGGVFGFILSRLVWNSFQVAWARTSKLPEPELVFGALAALAVFGAHALVEFVFQIPATALLAAALLGFVIGCRDLGSLPLVPPPPSSFRVALNLVWATALLAASLAQGWAYQHWRRSKAALQIKAPQTALTELDRSLQFWPWNRERQLARTRVQVASMAGKPPAEQFKLARDVRSQLQRVIARNPLSWELWLELVWLDLAFSNDHARTRDEMEKVRRLNPLQPQIPLRFARHLAARDPDTTWKLLQSTDLSNRRDLREALQIAWHLRGDTASLWVLVPDSPDGLLTLAEFATEQKLLPLAVQAYQRLGNRIDALTLAERFLQVQRPDLAIAQLSKTKPSPRQLLLTARAHAQNGSHVLAIHCAESAWRTHPESQRMMAPVAVTAPRATLLERWHSARADAQLAAELAESVCQQPAAQRDLALLRQLAAQFPANLHLTWLVFQTERDTGQLSAATGTALNLAARLAGKN